MATTKKLVAARREVERLRMQAGGAADTDLKIWEAGNRVSDLERADREAAVRTARRAALLMDAVLLIVATLTMGFSLQNIHDFAASHGVQDPIAWFLAPAVDLALVAALVGDAVLSRHQLDAGPWATRLRWYAGAATLTLNAWEAVASLDAAAIVLHVVPPVLLFVLAEAASPYRVKFADTVRLAGEQVASAPAADQVDTTEVDTPAPTAGEVYDQETDQAPAGADASPMSTQSPQEAEPAPLRALPAPAGADTAGERLDAKAARQAIEDAWTAGLTIREAATRATRSTSYVQGVYAQLTKARGDQPSKGQTTIEVAA
jgi:hypothetical protein